MVRERGSGARFYDELLGELLIAQELFFEHFDSNQPAQHIIPRFIDYRHAADAEFGYYFVSVFK
jgi:hypothetical protein